MTASFKPSEGISQGRCLSRKHRRDSDNAMLHKLPNEYRHAFTNFNYKCPDVNSEMDENDYYIQ